jgi:hypothetical protein
MNNIFLNYFLTFACVISVFVSKAQVSQSSKDIVLNNIKQWNVGFNKHDTVTYYKLVDEQIAVTSAGGTQISASEFKLMTNYLYTERPDITIYLYADKTEVNEEWELAYDSGNWIESWTEKNSKGKSVIKGKYWRMWKKENNNWLVMSIVLTPMSCNGDYCK